MATIAQSDRTVIERRRRAGEAFAPTNE